MPVIPVPSGDFLALFQGVFRLYLEPSSWESSRELEKGALGQPLISLLNHVGAQNIQLTKEEFDVIAAAQPDRIPLAVRLKDMNYGLMTAGHVLVYTLRLAKHMPRLASASTGMRILEWLYSTPRYNWPASPTSIKTAWRKYRSVAHFIGAANCMWEDYLELSQVFTSYLDASKENAKYILADRDMASKLIADKDRVLPALERAQRDTLPRFFAYAEALRRLGEAHYATGQDIHDRSLLDPGTAWSVPEGFELPAVRLDLPPLDADEVKAAGVK